MTETLTRSTIERDVDDHLDRVLHALRTFAQGGDAGCEPADDSVEDAIFELLTSREFCPLGRTKAEAYREATVAALRPYVEAGAPLRFYYDIGPGYHASIRLGERDLRFGMGLSELLILSQVTAFCSRVRRLYAPGAQFTLVVDNLCALYTNDIDVQQTAAYCAELRDLIAETGVADTVSVLVESEQFDRTEYDALFEAQPVGAVEVPPPHEVENVERFLGRRCSEQEAAERLERYVRAGTVTELLLARVVDGVRMTQRASQTTIGFRPFAGGDSRTQCGEVALSRSQKGHLRPFLLTHRNVDGYELIDLQARSLPSSIPSVSFADAT